MGKSRGSRRTVLQLNDNKESFLARYGYTRNDDDVDSRGSVENGEDSDEEQTAADYGVDPKLIDGTAANGAEIDDKVADFLAEIDALPANEENEEEEMDQDPPRPSFSVEIPPPSFKLSANQTNAYAPPKPEPEPEVVVEQSKPARSKSSYNRMFVQGASEFTETSKQSVTGPTESVEVEWPEEPESVWQQTLDENTQCFYYWNTVTNEVTWEIPPDFTRFLLLKKEYEETVEKLTKEGKVKPSKPKSKVVASSSAEDLNSNHGPQKAPEHTVEGPESSGVTSTSSTVPTKKGCLKNKDESTKPDSTNSVSGKPLLVDYFDDSDGNTTSSSSDSDSDDDKKKNPPKKDDSDSGDLDIDDIDKALDLAFEKKKTSKEKHSDKKESKSKDKEKPEKKEKTLFDEMKAQVQKKLEIEARRKAAIEEMMARELERRVGPPRKRSPESDLQQTVWDAKRSKTSEHSHSRRSRDDHDRDHDRDSKHKHKKKDDKDRRSKDKEDRSERHKSRDRDREEKKKDRHKDKHRDKDRDERKKSKDHKKDKSSPEKKKDDKDKKESKKSEKEKVMVEAEVEEPTKTKDKEEAPVLPVQEQPPIINPEERAKEVQLANLKMQASELADLALSKLEFLEVTKKGLSKLQILLIELETRHGDWTAGGLSTEYFVTKLDEANWQLQQYEQSAAPPGWTCHWDRAYRRYFYMNKRHKKTQWDYPDDDDQEDIEDIQNSHGSDQEGDDTAEPKPPAGHPEGMEEMVTTENIELPAPDNQSETQTAAVNGHDPDPVSSTVVSSGVNDAPMPPDTTFPVVSSSSSSTHSEMSSANESVVQEEKPETSVQSAPGLSVPQQPTFNYITGQEMNSIFRGEPPPPGTDLELLLSAPPPPPPPPPEEDTVTGGHHGYGGDVMDDGGTNMKDQYDSRISAEPNNSDMEMDDVMPSNVQIFTDQVSSNKVSPYYASEDIDGEPYTNTKATGISSIIARGPQMFTDPSQTYQNFGDTSYYGNSGEGDHAETDQYSAAEVSNVSHVPSSTTMETEGGFGEGSSQLSSTVMLVEKEKKKKKKDKSISSSSLNLKKKGVSSLVQKWQKVKKEVEIEERHREEREMAIRQKLEEWKQEHN